MKFNYDQIQRHVNENPASCKYSFLRLVTKGGIMGEARQVVAARGTNRWSCKFHIRILPQALAENECASVELKFSLHVTAERFGLGSA